MKPKVFKYIVYCVLSVYVYSAGAHRANTWTSTNENDINITVEQILPRSSSADYTLIVSSDKSLNQICSLYNQFDNTHSSNNNYPIVWMDDDDDDEPFPIPMPSTKRYHQTLTIPHGKVGIKSKLFLAGMILDLSKAGSFSRNSTFQMERGTDLHIDSSEISRIAPDCSYRANPQECLSQKDFENLIIAKARDVCLSY